MLARAAGPQKDVSSFRFTTRVPRDPPGRLPRIMWQRHTFNTRLDRWLVAHKVKPVRLALESGYSRQHLLRIRKSEMEPTRACIAAIVLACRRLSGVAVKASELFDLGD